MPKRVLLAEDDEEMARLLTDTLSQQGYEVVGAANGVELLDHVEDFRHQVINGRFYDVDLIVSDIRMPWMNGLEMLRELRLIDKMTPVILITAFGDERTHAEANRLGAAAVLDKPFELDDFRDAVRSCSMSAEDREEIENDSTTDSFRVG